MLLISKFMRTFAFTSVLGLLTICLSTTSNTSSRHVYSIASAKELALDSLISTSFETSLDKPSRYQAYLTHGLSAFWVNVIQGMGRVAVNQGYGGAWPTFEQADYHDSRGIVLGMVLINKRCTEWQDIPLSEIDDSTPESTIRTVGRYAVQRGYAAGFPNFEQADYGNGVVKGAILLRHECVEKLDIAASEVDASTSENLARTISRYAFGNGYSGGFPNFEQADYGNGVVFGAILFKSFAVNVVDASKEDFVSPTFSDNVQFFSWKQGEPPTQMLEANHTTCFLQSVSGKFDGKGEAVWIRLDPSEKYWVLNGKSKQRDVAATALCVRVDLIQPGSSWLRVTVPKKIEVTYGDNCGFLSSCSYDGKTSALESLDGMRNIVCYLTGIGGNFNGGGEIMRVANFPLGYLSPSARYYYRLEVLTRASHIQAEAGCIFDEASSIPFDVMPSDKSMYTWRQDEPYIRLPHRDRAICFLNSVSGKFEGHGESVGIFLDANGTQWLGGMSNQKDIAVGSICIPFRPK